MWTGRAPAKHGNHLVDKGEHVCPRSPAACTVLFVAALLLVSVAFSLIHRLLVSVSPPLVLPFSLIINNPPHILYFSSAFFLSLYSLSSTLN